MGRSLRFRGFTLIELLIVVAIIAILAAIAVPNFLEAQTRAKVSRGKADQRTLATAIEAYTIDFNKPPYGNTALGSSNPKFYNWGPNTAGSGAYPGDEAQTNRMWAQLTTPISYIGAIPDDPFANIGSKGGVTEAAATQFSRKQYYYESWPSTGKGFGPSAGFMLVTAGNANFIIAVAATGVSWSLQSYGPTRVGVNIGRCGGFMPEALAGKVPQFPNSFYDPTNGTVSFGNVVRTNKGVAPEGIGNNGTGVIGSMNTAC